MGICVCCFSLLWRERAEPNANTARDLLGTFVDNLGAPKCLIINKGQVKVLNGSCVCHPMDPEGGHCAGPSDVSV